MSARDSRAAAPVRTVKRAPASFDAALEVEDAEGRAEVPVRLRREVELRRRSPRCARRGCAVSSLPRGTDVLRARSGRASRPRRASASASSSRSSSSRISSLSAFISASASGDGLALDGGELVAAAALLLEPRDRVAALAVELDVTSRGPAPPKRSGISASRRAAFSRRNSRGSIDDSDFISRTPIESTVNRLSGAPHLPDVDAVVVNRDGGDALFRALASLERAEGRGALACSSWTTTRRPDERAPDRRARPRRRASSRSRATSGFAGAANEGIARTRAPFVLLLNNDAVLEPDYVARLAARLDARRAAGRGPGARPDARTGGSVDTAGLEWNGRGEAVPVLSGADASAAPARALRGVGRLGHGGALPPRGARGRRRRGGAGVRRAPSSRTTRTWTCRCACRARAGGSRATRARSRGTRARAPGRRTPFRRAFWTARNRWRTLFRNFDAGAARAAASGRSCARTSRTSRAVGWRGLALPLLVWPRLPFDGARARGSEPRTARRAGPGRAVTP